MRFHRILVAIVLPVLFAASAWSDEASRRERRESFLKMLDRPKVDLDVRAFDTKTDGDGFVTERLDFASEKRPDGGVERVPTLVIRPAVPAGKRLPAVLSLHGTGGNKEGQRDWMLWLAKRGFVAIAIDARFHGDRSGGAKGATAYNEAIVRAWRSKPGEPQAHPFYYDTCWDIWRTADYLATRADVDPERIGIIGFSMGGIQTWLAAAVDTRYKVSVPAIGVQPFKWSLENDKWQARAKTIKAAHDAAAADLGESAVNAEVCRKLWNKVIPGMLNEYDCPNMIALFAGRPLLIVNGELDPNCPLEGAEVSFAAARKAFAEQGAEDMLRIDVAKGVAHAVTPEQRVKALDWFEKWLKP